MPRSKRFAREDYVAILADMEETGDPILVCCQRRGMGYTTFVRNVRKDEELQKRYDDAKAANERKRVQVAWHTVETALRQRDDKGRVTMIALKAALALLYSKGELIDHRARQTVTAESPHGKLVVTFGDVGGGKEEEGDKADGDGGGEG